MLKGMVLSTAYSETIMSVIYADIIWMRLRKMKMLSSAFIADPKKHVTILPRQGIQCIPLFPPNWKLKVIKRLKCMLQE